MSRPLRVVVKLGAAEAALAGAQHFAWLLVTLLTRSTSAVIEAIGIDVPDAALVPGVDPGAPDGGIGLRDALVATAERFGPSAAPVGDLATLSDADLVLQFGAGSEVRSPGVQVVYVAATAWTGSIAPDPAALFAPELELDVPFGPYIAACLAAGQAFMFARVRDHHIPTVALNAWTLDQATTDVTDLTAVAEVNPGSPIVALDQVLAGAGAVGSALLLTLWAYENASGIIRAADADPEGVDETNLNRCVPYWWTDLGNPKAETAADRLNGRHGLVIEPTNGRAEGLVDKVTQLVSAVDVPEAREALQDRYPASIVQASTAGLRLEMLRVDPTVRTACIRCFNPPRTKTPDAEVRGLIARMNEAILAEHAAAVGATTDMVKEWGRVGGCGTIGDALLHRLRPSDGSAAQFSVGFVSVLAGVLLAAQVIKDTLRRDGDPNGIVGDVGLLGERARFVTNLLDPVNSPVGVRRYGRDSSCPSCEGARASVWRGRWTG